MFPTIWRLLLADLPTRIGAQASRIHAGHAEGWAGHRPSRPVTAALLGRRKARQPSRQVTGRSGGSSRPYYRVRPALRTGFGLLRPAETMNHPHLAIVLAEGCLLCCSRLMARSCYWYQDYRSPITKSCHLSPHMSQGTCSRRRITCCWMSRCGTCAVLPLPALPQCLVPERPPRRTSALCPSSLHPS